MAINSAAEVFFSPTGTTKKILDAVADGLGAGSVRKIDLTRPEYRMKFDGAVAEDAVLIGMPVYEETIPEITEMALRSLKGRSQPAVLIAVYGNIGYGIALKQLNEIAQICGFMPIAAGAFIGEHSFSTESTPVACGRPDAADLEKARAFGLAVRQRVEAGVEEGSRLDVRGHLPLMARILPKGSANWFSRAPSLDGFICNRCGACVKICPAGAIDIGTLGIDSSRCLRCFACARRCPKKARKVIYRKKLLVRAMLTLQGGRRKEPETYLI